MRGSIQQRYPGSWSLIFDLGYHTDPLTGARKRKQKWVTFRGTKRDAEKKLTDMLRDANRGAFVEPSKVTVADWLRQWFRETIEPRKARSTVDSYRHIIEQHLIPFVTATGATLGAILLQTLRPGTIEEYYGFQRKQGLLGATLQVHHAVLSGALKSALRHDLIHRNVAALIDDRPESKDSREETSVEAKVHCWTGAEARAVLAASKALSPLLGALYAVALDSGARKGEILGLRWTDVDLDSGLVTFERTLLRGTTDDGLPLFGKLKNPARGNPKIRTVELNAETVDLLRAHKRAQAEIKMRNRTAYRDLGLVFAREERTDDLPVGWVLNLHRFGHEAVVTAAGVKRIKFHGLRHTSATLMLSAGEPVHNVAAVLGHAKPTITLNVYAHVLSGSQAATTKRRGAVLYG